MLEYFPALSAVPGLRHALSTRAGGVSAGPYATLNLGYHVGDDAARVTDNRRRLAAAAGYPADALVTGRQVHGTALAWATAADRGRGAFGGETALPGVDGLLTAERGVPVAVLVADCAPVALVDPRLRRLAVVHAGWRGALGRIASAAVRALAAAGSAPADCLAAIGPALCPACLEVGDEVAAQVAPAFPAGVRSTADRPRLDLHRMITDDLIAAGVPAARIARHPACTRCRPDRFFSHRAQGGQAGRFALLAWWE